MATTQSEPAGGGQPWPDVLTAQEAADWIRIPLKSLYELAKAGRIPSRKAGKEYRFSRAAVLDWLQGPKNRVALTR